MFKTMKMSKYNLNTYDHEGNLILYNFLKGISSLTKVMRSDVDKFTQLFLADTEIHSTLCEEHAGAVDVLRKSGILISNDTDEIFLYNSKNYDEAYDSKLSLTILPTGDCNFKCPYCFEASVPFTRCAMSVDSQDAIFKFVQKRILSHRALNVSWFGGEPLLEPEIIKRLSSKFIHLCDRRLLSYSADITTNGFFLDGEMFDMLYKLKVYIYMITIDGFKKQHDRLRFTDDGLGSYDIIMNNLLRIRDNKQYKFAKILIRVNVSKGFLDTLDEFVFFIASSFSDDPRFQIYFLPVFDYLNSERLDNSIFIDPSEFSLQLTKNEVYANKLCTEESKIFRIIPGTKCRAALKNSYVITPDLNVNKCYVYYDYDINKIGHINFKGDLLIDEDLHKRWYLSKIFNHKVPEACNDCFYLPCCHNNNAHCPTKYFDTMSHVAPCQMKDEVFKKQLIDDVLYVAQKYPCTILVL